MDKNRAARFMWEEGDVQLLSNKNMQCVDCKFKIENNAIECEIYEVKPGPVLDNEKPCPKWKKK
ncbi:MAG: hypothetical protein LBD23_11530 [Oscillospiraceae bacterium]|nr:hypothetical protein [Oscillospiraceae bacterium]